MNPLLVEIPLALLCVTVVLLILSLLRNVGSRPQQLFIIFAFLLILVINFVAAAYELGRLNLLVTRVLLQPLSLWLIPAFFLYLRGSLPKEWKPARWILIHALPGFLVCLILSWSFRKGEPATFSSLLAGIAAVRAVLIHPFYLFLTFSLLKRYQKEVVLNRSGHDYYGDWLRACTVLFSLVCAADLAGVLILNTFGFTLNWNLLFALGFLGLLAQSLFASPQFRDEEWVESPPQTMLDRASEIVDRPTLPKYEKSGMNESDLESGWIRIQAALTSRQLFLNPNLKLSELAREARLSTHQCSEVINRRGKMNFYELVSLSRVEEVKRRLLNPDNDKLSILQIAYETGFNSKSTFNSSFKKIVGLAPGEFRNRAHVATSAP
jgi:AraC-like DNA-binding protein